MSPASQAGFLQALLLFALALPGTLAAQPELYIRNYHIVDAHVIRGAEPGIEGVRALSASGVKTILDLRPGEERTDREREEAKALGVKYVNVPMKGLHAPTDEQIAAALDTLSDPAAWPVFVHCKHGRDRTGTVVACYRMEHDNWDAQRAFAEAKQFGLSGWERGMKTYILTYEPRTTKTATAQK